MSRRRSAQEPTTRRLACGHHGGLADRCRVPAHLLSRRSGERIGLRLGDHHGAPTPDDHDGCGRRGRGSLYLAPAARPSASGRGRYRAHCAPQRDGWKGAVGRRRLRLAQLPLLLRHKRLHLKGWLKGRLQGRHEPHRLSLGLSRALGRDPRRGCGSRQAKRQRGCRHGQRCERQHGPQRRRQRGRRSRR